MTVEDVYKLLGLILATLLCSVTRHSDETAYQASGAS